MSNLWIRSQDKEMLVNSNGFQLQQHYEDSPCQIFAVWNNNYMCVGAYKTKERALEILDEIQKFMGPKDRKAEYKEIDLVLKTYMIPRVYKMPKK